MRRARRLRERKRWRASGANAAKARKAGVRCITEPGRVIVRDPSGQSFIRHNEVDRFRYGARDIRTERVGNDTRTIVIRPDGTQIITVNDRNGQLMRRIRRDQRGREIIIIDNSYRGPRGVGGFYVDLAPPILRIPQNRYIVEADDASPDLLYDTMIAPPVERLDRRYSLDEIRYSASVRQRMPSIDHQQHQLRNRIVGNPPDQASKLQAIADGLNRAIAANPRAVFLIEGHTDKVGSDVDNLSLSDRRAESAATLLTQQFNVPTENLTSQGYGEQYPKEDVDGPSADQSPRHDPQHRAAAQWRIGIAAAPAARHRAAALRQARRNKKWPGEIPAIFYLTVQALRARGGRQASQIAAT